MQLTVVGDPHLKHKFLDIAKCLFSLVEEIGKPCVWMGDLFDTKEVIRGKCLNTAIEYFKTSKLPHYILVGNHDWFNLECEAHSLEALKLLPNVKIIDEPFAMQTLDIVMIPYIHDKVKLKEILTRYQNRHTTLFAHLELSDFDFGNGHICTTGLALEDLAGFKRVISGHFHKYQTKGNLTYIGTPFSQSFGETDQVKYLGLYDVVKDELLLADTPFPKHVTIEFDCDGLNENLEHWIIDTDKPGWQNNYYRVILTGTQANIDRFPRHMYGLMIKWISRPSDHAENNAVIDETVSNEAQFTKWASDIRKMDEETVKLGLEIMEACR